MKRKIILKNQFEGERDSTGISFPEIKVKVVSSKQYRTPIRVFGDILGVIKEGGREGVILSAISRKANLAHYAALSKCNQLISAGLIEEKISDQRKSFLITEKGLTFFEEYENFQNLVEPLNLKY